MYKHFRLLSLTYRSASLEVREKVSLNQDDSADFLVKLQSYTNVEESLILSTCNRTEIYYSAEENLSEVILKLLKIEKSLPESFALEQYFNEVEGMSAIRHLFKVAIGLDSQLVGDMQITNQVKKAYQTSADNNMAGPFLHRLLHTIFFTNKKVVQETPFRDGAASVSYAASELAYDLASEIINPKLLIIGLGEIGTDTCKNIGDSDQLENLHKVTIINRTQEKADSLSYQYGFVSRKFVEAYDAINEADIVISAVSLEDPLVDKSSVEKLNFTYKYFIDLSVPRGIAADVEDVPGALVYNIDDIRSKADEVMRKRMEAIPMVQQIIENALGDIKNWVQEMEVSPTIHRLKNALEKIRQDEIARHIKSLDAKESEQVDKITKGIMQKIIKLPVLQLKAACKRGEAETLIDVLNDLFDLEKQQATKIKSD